MCEADNNLILAEATRVGQGKMALVYDHARLALKVTPPEGGGLETHLEIGLTGGALKLRSLKTPNDE